MSDYLPRVVDAELDELLGSLPAVAVEGPKGVGKTETARRRAARVVALDDPAIREIARADIAHVLNGTRPVLIDEWQQVPSVWDAIRRAVDKDRRANQFLLTGSASPATAPTHSGAGRIVTLRMRPLALCERGLCKPSVSLAELLQGKRPSVSGATKITLADYVDEILASGFPGLRGLRGRAMRAQLDGYLQRIVDRDFAAQGVGIRNPQGLLRWMTALAAATSTTASFETIRDAATSGEGQSRRARPSSLTATCWSDSGLPIPYPPGYRRGTRSVAFRSRRSISWPIPRWLRDCSVWTGMHCSEPTLDHPPGHATAACSGACSSHWSRCRCACARKPRRRG